MASTLAEFREERDAALKKTDCIYRPDIIKNFDEGELAGFEIYCQQLRDATEGVTDENSSDATLPSPCCPRIAEFLKIEN